MRLMITRVRGVYTIGITKLLLDAGFSIARPTGAIRERFRIEDVSREEDVSIYDRKDKLTLPAPYITAVFAIATTPQ